jgi:hypothetical protein
MRSLRQFIVLCSIILEVQPGPALGAQWSEANTGLTASSHPGVRMVAIDHAGSTLYAVTGAQGVFKSTDGGSNWRALGRITGAFVIAIDPMSPSTVYGGRAVGQSGVRLGSRSDHAIDCVRGGRG